MNKRALDRWRQLKFVGVGDGVIEVPSIDSGVDTGYGRARYALGDQGQPRLLVPIGWMIMDGEQVSTSKLRVTLARFDVRGTATLFLDVMCLDRALDPVFAELAEEILRRVGEGVAPVAAVRDSIDDFRTLLREDRREASESVILGLVGELEVLRRLASHNPESLAMWVGPLEQRHDFRRDSHALEVKTSGRADATTVTIHGIEQLAAPANGSLHLVHVRLEQVGAGALSVGTIFDDLVELGCGKSKLREMLAALGCDDPHAEAWNRLTFSLEGLSCYQVVEGFPRIVLASFSGGSLPAGVGAVEYQLDLVQAAAYIVPVSGTDKVFARIADDENRAFQ